MPYTGKSKQKNGCFDLDATYGDNQTYELLEILRNNNIKATFFLSGIWLINYPQLARAIAAEGHEIGNHSYTHPHMPLITMQEVTNQIVRTEALIRNITGQDPYLFRPPFGEYTQTLLNQLASLGYVTIMWTIDSIDWKNPGADAVVSRVVDNAEPGAIILMHQSAPDTLQGLQTMITQ